MRLRRIKRRSKQKNSSKSNYKLAAKTTVPVPDWLSARYLLRTLDDDVIVSCFDQIIETFTDKKDTIGHLVRAANTEQLKNIIKILKSAQLKHIENNDHTIMIDYKENNSYFDYLSNESILNICQFLTRSDMSQFKTSSTLISLNVFEMMKMRSISMVNMNELLVHKQYKYPLYLDIQKCLKTHMVKPFIKFRSVLQMSSKMYNIPTENTLMVCSHNEVAYEYQIVSENSTLKDNHTSKFKYFFIFDTRNILKLDNTNKSKMINNYDLEQKSNRMILLQYFDVHQQRIQNIQFLWTHQSTPTKQIEKYITNQLYSFCTKMNQNINASLEWCTQLLYTINKMKEFGSHRKTPILNFYELRNDPYTLYPEFEYIQYEPFTVYNTKDTNDFSIVLFETNDAHPYFKVNDNSSDISRSVPLYRFVNVYVSDQSKKIALTAHCVTQKPVLLKQLQYFDMQKTYDFNCKMNLELSKTPLMTADMIRAQISNRFGGIIPIHNINLWERYQPEWCRNLSNDDASALYDWEIVPYDVEDLKAKLFEIEVYLYQRNISNMNKYLDTFRAPHKPMTNFQMKYCDFERVYVNPANEEKTEKFSWNISKKKEMCQYKVKVKEFIKCAIETASHPMYGGTYDEVTIKYKENDSYAFIIVNKENTERKFRCFDGNDEYVSNNSQNKVCIAIIPNIYIGKEENDIQMRKCEFCSAEKNNLLRCSKCKQVYYCSIQCQKPDWGKHKNLCQKRRLYPIIVRLAKYSVFEFVEIGYPLKVWITSECTVKSVWKKCIDNEEKWELVSCSSASGELEMNDTICDKFDKTVTTFELLIVIQSNTF